MSKSKKQEIEKLVQKIEVIINNDIEFRHSCKKWNEECSRCQLDRALTVLKNYGE